MTQTPAGTAPDKRTPPLLRYGLLFVAFLIYSFATVFAKYAALSDGGFRFWLFLGLEILTLGVYALLWQQALRYTSLIAAMAMKGVVVIFGLVWSVLFFGEDITRNNIIGALIIVAGIWVVSQDG